MAKIAFIGAGSVGFTRTLVKDLLTFPTLDGVTLALMDIDDDRLDMAKRSVQRIVDEGKYNAKVVATKSRKEALKDADAVLCTILSGGVDVWRYDIEIPKKFGVDICVGDTRGPAGIFRALRTIPDMLDICRDMEQHCPNAILLNYTNPMAMLCRAMQRSTGLKVSGLCHSVQGTAEMLARWIGAPIEEIDYTSAGINHLSWYIKFDWKGQDAYPLIRKAVAGSRKIYNEEHVRNEMFLAAGVLRHRVERAQLGVQLVVPQAARPDREALRHGHGLEPRRVRLHPQALPGPRQVVEEGTGGVAQRSQAARPVARA